MLTLHYLLLLLIQISSVTYATAEEGEYLEPNVKRIVNVIPISICNTLIDLGEEGKSTSYVYTIRRIYLHIIHFLLSVMIILVCAFIAPILCTIAICNCNVIVCLLYAYLFCFICNKCTSHHTSWFPRPRRINRPRRTF